MSDIKEDYGKFVDHDIRNNLILHSETHYPIKKKSSITIERKRSASLTKRDA